VWECHSTGSDADVCLTKNTNKKHPEYGKAGKDLASAPSRAMSGSAAAERRGAGMPTTRICTWCITEPATPAFGRRNIGGRADNAGELQ